MGYPHVPPEIELVQKLDKAVKAMEETVLLSGHQETIVKEQEEQQPQEESACDDDDDDEEEEEEEEREERNEQREETPACAWKCGGCGHVLFTGDDVVRHGKTEELKARER